MPNPYKIDEAAEFILDFGVKFSETGAGAEVLRMAAFRQSAWNDGLERILQRGEI